MDIKVKEVEGPGQKSVQEVEEQLLEQHEQEVNNDVDNVDVSVNNDVDNIDVSVNNDVDNTETQTSELSEEDVLSFIKKKYEKEVSSIDDLFATPEVKSEELPEDVSAFLKYKKETGRGIQDFMKLQVNYDEMDPNKLLKDYYAEVEKDLDAEDIDYLMSEKFSYDEDLDDESEVKSKKIAFKKELAKAKEHFNKLKEAYTVPTESVKESANLEESEDYKAYKEYIAKSKSYQEETQKMTEYFKKKTDELFTEDFKGFEFNVGDDKVVFSPGDLSKTKEVQSDINNFISKYVGDDGLITDPAGYHKALAAALNPDKLANYFYEKGKADAVVDVSKRSKNIDMDVRSTPKQAVTTNGLKIRAVESDSGRGLKIKKR
jgi:hypothetical protein